MISPRSLSTPSFQPRALGVVCGHALRAPFGSQQHWQRPQRAVQTLRAFSSMDKVGGNQGQEGYIQPEGDDTRQGLRTFWGIVDMGAWLGALGTAVAFMLTQEALLVGGPLVLPLVAIFASRQQRRMDAEVSPAYAGMCFCCIYKHHAALCQSACMCCVMALWMVLVACDVF
jgi:hypothetical protein